MGNRDSQHKAVRWLKNPNQVEHMSSVIATSNPRNQEIGKESEIQINHQFSRNTDNGKNLSLPYSLDRIPSDISNINQDPDGRSGAVAVPGIDASSPSSACQSNFGNITEATSASSFPQDNLEENGDADKKF